MVHLTVGNNYAICWGHVSSRHGVLLFGDGLYTFYHGIHPHFASPAWGNGSLIDVTGTAVEEEAPFFSWLLLYSKWVGLFYVRLGGGFKSVFNVIIISYYFYLGLGIICYMLTDIFQLGGSTTTSKTSGLIPPTKIGFYTNDFCFRTPTSGCKSTWTLRWLEAKSCELYQCNLHGWSVYWFHLIFFRLPTSKFFVSLQTNMLF